MAQGTLSLTPCASAQLDSQAGQDPTATMVPPGPSRPLGENPRGRGAIMPTADVGRFSVPCSCLAHPVRYWGLWAKMHLLQGAGTE